MSDLLFGAFGEKILDFIHNFSNSILDLYFSIITTIGDPLPMLIIIVLLYYTVNKDFIAKLAYIIIISVHFNLVIKAFFHQLRPYQYDPRFRVTTNFGIEIVWGEKGFSFPSGHSQTQGTFWGYIFSKYRKPLYVVIGLILLFSIPLSRSYLGVHWPSDIIVGVLLGLLCSYLFIHADKRFGNQIKLMTDSRKILLGIILSVCLFILGIFTLILGSFFEFNNAISLSDHADIWEGTDLGRYPGILAGLIIGQILEKKYVNFGYKEKEWRSILIRAIFGIISATVLYMGNKAFTGVFEEIQQKSLAWIIIVAEYFSYFIIGLTLIFIVPWIFVKLESNIYRNKS